VIFWGSNKVPGWILGKFGGWTIATQGGTTLRLGVSLLRANFCRGRGATGARRRPCTRGLGAGARGRQAGACIADSQAEVYIMNDIRHSLITSSYRDH